MRFHDQEPVSEQTSVVPQVSKTDAEKTPSGNPAGPLDAGTVLALQRSVGNAGVTAMLSDAIGSGSGAPLDTGTRGVMEAHLGHDFSDVRIHTGDAATRSAESLGAQAYTVGRDVVVSSDHWAPDTGAGQRLLAHELTHVAQQEAGPVDGTPTGDGLAVSDPGDRFEQEAERAAESFGT
jgi:hypothetical protein